MASATSPCPRDVKWTPSKNSLSALCCRLHHDLSGLGPQPLNFNVPLVGGWLLEAAAWPLPRNCSRHWASVAAADLPNLPRAWGQGGPCYYSCSEKVGFIAAHSRGSEEVRMFSVRRYSTALLALTGAMFLVTIYTPFANVLAMPLWRIPPAPMVADIAVVLSGGRYDDGSLNEEALERTVTGVRLYYQGLVPRLLFTGGPCCGESASALMAKFATELGVPRDAVLLEEESTRTHDSATNSVALLHRRGLRSVILVTSALHMPRARLAFAAAGMSVYPVLASNRNLFLLSRANERIGLLQDAMHEYLGLALYRARGWI
jgi:uncharacterized SAM-binding protein YcdF (DUF218 family)